MKSLKTLEAEYLFTFNPNATKQGEDKSDVFHTKFSKSICLYNRARPDI